MSSPTKFTLDSSLFNQDLYASILHLWLPSYPIPSSQFTQEDAIRWFRSSATTDKQVRTLAGDAISSIGPDHLTLPPSESLEADDDEALSNDIAAPFIPELSRQSSSLSDETAAAAVAHTALALSILLDQFPRSLFRGPDQPIVYTHYDRLARAVARQIYARGLDRAACFAHAPVWRLWFYLPLEHAESMPAHDRFRVVLGEMRAQAGDRRDESGARFVEKALEAEERHLRPLREFGRFPWRNRWLGRESTEAERRWLEEGGDRFGTGG